MYEITIKHDFFKTLLIEFPHPPSKAKRKKTRVNVINFTFCEFVLFPSGIRNAVAVTTIIQLDLLFKKLKFSYVVLNKAHRLPTI